jgi:hypothetical protein
MFSKLSLCEVEGVAREHDANPRLQALTWTSIPTSVQWSAFYVVINAMTPVHGMAIIDEPWRSVPFSHFQYPKPIHKGECPHMAWKA